MKFHCLIACSLLYSALADCTCSDSLQSVRDSPADGSSPTIIIASDGDAVGLMGGKGLYYKSKARTVESNGNRVESIGGNSIGSGSNYEWSPYPPKKVNLRANDNSAVNQQYVKSGKSLGTISTGPIDSHQEERVYPPVQTRSTQSQNTIQKQAQKQPQSQTTQQQQPQQQQQQQTQQQQQQQQTSSQSQTIQSKTVQQQATNSGSSSSSNSGSNSGSSSSSVSSSNSQPITVTGDSSQSTTTIIADAPKESKSNVVYGTLNTCRGQKNYIDGKCNTVIGQSNEVQSRDQHIVGNGNQVYDDVDLSTIDLSRFPSFCNRRQY